VYSDWRGHVIVCGLHRVGLRIVQQLSLSGVPAVVVDDNSSPMAVGETPVTFAWTQDLR
jgi:voltage-gated potassium channel Kch